MNIPGVSTAPTTAPLLVSRVVADPVPAAAQAQTAAALLSQTTVDLSPLGRFLSAITLFQKRLLELQSGTATPPAGQTVADVAGAVSAVAERANELQASVIAGSAGDQQLATLFGQQFAAQTPGNEDDDSSSLAAIGLRFASPGEPDGNVLDVDTERLQAAFENDPDGTVALLDRSANAFAALTGITAAATAIDDATLLLPDPLAPSDPLTPVLPAPPGFPGLDPLPPQQFSEDAFLQELLAETPRPVLNQAPPPALADAEASFAAQRAAEAEPAEADNVLGTQADNTAARPATARREASAAQTVAPASVAAAPPAPVGEFVQPAQSTAIPAQQGSPVSTTPAGPAAPAAPGNEAARPTATFETALAAFEPEADRSADKQITAAQDVAREANARLADTISAEREANERINARDEVERADLAAQREQQALDQAGTNRLRELRLEQARVDDITEQRRLQGLEDHSALPIETQETVTPGRRRVTAAATLPAIPGEGGDASMVNGLPLAQLQPANDAQQLARDPATMAAIAAYNLGAGPFAALHGRPEMAAQRPKAVPAVETVKKVAAIEADAATSEFSRPSR